MSERKIAFKADLSLIHKAVPFMAKNDFSYYLNGFHIRKASGDGCIIEATNGSMMILLYDPNGMAPEGDGVIIEPFITAKLPKHGDLIIYKDDPETMNVCPCLFSKDRTVVGQSFTSGWKIEGKFPDTKRALPKWENLKPGINAETINPKLLINLLKAFPCDKGGIEGIHIHGSCDKSNGAIVITSENRNIVAVMLGMRSDPLTSHPEWI